MSSLKKRYLSKLLNNLTGLTIGLITQSIVPRALGPSAYGNFSFLTSFFQQVTGFLNLNSSTAFYTKLSKNQTNKALVGFYSYIILFIAFCISVVVILPFATGIHSTIWPEQKFVYVAMAAMYAFFLFYSNTLSDMSDAYGITVQTEAIKTIIKVVGLLIILLMFYKHLFTLSNYFIYQFFILALTALLLSSRIKQTKMPYLWESKPTPIEFLKYKKEFAAFCMPLFVFIALSILEQIGDRWFLQLFSGSTKQGYYALAYQVGAICFLFTSAIIPLILREQSISFGNNDHSKIRHSFMRYASLLYVLTAFFCCFIVIESQNVLKFFGGTAYSGALIPLMLMCLYPIHQTYGQLNANLFFATERVKTYRNIGLIFIAIGIPSTIFLLGPQKYGALHLGATGLAIKMVVLQIISTNVQLWFNTKFLGASFKELVLHQFIVVSVLIAIAYIGSYLINVLMVNSNYILKFMLSGFLYTSITFILAFFIPSIFKMTKNDFTQLFGFIKKNIQTNKTL